MAMIPRHKHRTQPTCPRPPRAPPALRPTVLDGKLRPQGNPCSPRPTRRSPQSRTDSRDLNGPWGDQISGKKIGFRIGFQNINGLPIDPRHDIYKTLPEDLAKYEFDIFGAQEINLNLKHLAPSHSWGRRFQGNKVFNIAASNIHTTSQERRLFGGTALFLQPFSSARSTDHGHDDTGLGRWSWVSLQGRRGICTRIITGYRPIKDFSNRPGTVYSQQEKFFHEQGHPRDPRTAFLEDLGVVIRQWTQDGDQVVLGLDTNEYIFSGDIARWVNSLGLIPALQQLHPQLPEVATCDKGSRQIPIDGIWVTPSLDVIYGGMSGFGDCFTGPSDHRLLWIEVSNDSILGYRPSPPISRQSMTLAIRDPLSIQKYNNYVRRQRNLHRIPLKLDQLRYKANMGIFSTADETQYNQLCTLDDGIRKQARKAARTFYAGQVLYSDVIGQDYREIRLWQLIIKRKSGRRTDTRHIRRLMRLTNQPHALQMTWEQAKSAQRTCIQRYRQHKKDQYQLRDKFERKQDERIADAKGITLASQQKIRTTTRQLKARFAAIRNVITNKSRVPLFTAEYTTEFGDTIECVQKDDIERACQREGQRRFLQAANTPFLQGSLLQDLGFLASQPATDAILNGTYQCGHDVDRYTKLFIDELRLPDEIASLPPISGDATTEEHSSAWQRMHPFTASSSFGPLFSDFIVGAKNSEVAAIDNLFATIPLKACFCPLSWVKAVDVMIPKKKTSLNVDKLRIIVLFHAMFNLINKRVGRRMIQRAYDFQQIPLEAFGSVPNRQANVCALNKALVNDTLRQQRRPAALCSNDATSCYDRIVHVVASLCMQRLGVESNTCRVMFGTLQNLQHYVATAYGTSSRSYGGLQFPLQGVGQGNGAGPAIWLVITIPLINMLRKQGFGFRSISPISQHHCHIACFTYVDDTDTIHAPINTNASAQQVMAEIQEAINVWSGGLQATGGILSPAKSYWYLLDFSWHSNSLTWKYKGISDTPGTLFFNIEDSPVQITRHEPSHVVETLGIPLAMDGNQTAILDSIRMKINKWAGKIQTRQLTSRETMISLQSGITKSIEYPLVSTRLTRSQCNELLRPLRQAALPALGIPITFPTMLVHTPKEFLGLGLPNLWFEQNFAQIGCMLHHSGDVSSDSTAQLYLHVVEGMRVELGVINHPLTYDYYKLHLCTTQTQLHPAWQFCTDTGLSLKDASELWIPPRMHDDSLMELFLQTGYSPKELKMLNVCRMFLQIIYVSDVCTGDGIYLDEALARRRTPFQHHSHIQWPRAGQPSKNCWTLWETALGTLTLPSERHFLPRLKQPLGAWKRIPPGWMYFSHPPSRQLFQRLDAYNFLRATATIPRYGTRTQQYRLQNDTVPTIPANAIPTTIRTRGNVWYHTGETRIDLQPTPEPPCWWGTIIHRPADMDMLVHGILQGTAIMVTDGSFKDGLGTAAFSLRSHIQHLDGLDAVNMTPGWDTEIDPYRAELAGIYGCLQLAQLLVQKYNIASGSITLACDCSSALYRLQQPKPPRPSVPHFDLLQACRAVLKNSPIHWTFLHVRGHQDAHTRYELLDRYSQLNVDMDQLAKSYWNVLNSNRPPAFSLPPEQHHWTLWQGQHRITTWDRYTAQKCFYNHATQQYWRDRSNTPLQNVDWMACGMALRRVTATQQIWIPRWLTSFLPTGNRTKYFNSDHDSLCPRCHNEESHRYHVIRCPQPAAQVLWQRSIINLESWMITQHTKPSLRIGILSLLDHWYNDTSWVPPPSNDPDDLRAFLQQQQDGTARAIDGFLVKEWAESQHQYYLWLNRKTTGQRWLARLIQKLWEIAWDLWRHRHKVLHSPTSLALSRIHTNLDEDILDLYNTYTPDPPPHLARWFARPYPTIIAETVDFKRQWLEMMDVLITPPCPLP